MYDLITSLMDRLNVAPDLREECFNELVVGYLEGKTEQQMTWMVINFCRNSKVRLAELNERTCGSYYLPENDNSTFKVMSMIAQWTEQGVVTLKQANYLWRHILGDNSILIAKDDGVHRTVVVKQLKNTIRNLRIAYGLEQPKKNGRPKKERIA
ncbi:hypothetical protein [Brevibacillus centrosporus]|uniref:hypothetical protein n=1 Tax=Brevibacillus centrosporus TaxID=54910 RepID=UPI002E1D73DD|nr:hypothetical protein [Brevibacillus centrosporus]